MEDEKKELEPAANEFDNAENKIIPNLRSTKTKEQNYVITIEGKNKRRKIYLSAFSFNTGIFLLMVGAFVFIGTCGYSVYSALHHSQNVEIVRSMQRAGEMQQEQLLSISKKAVNLSETIQNLAQQEEELRIQAGLSKPAKADKIPENMKLDEEIPELEEIKPIEGLPKPEDVPALENLPATVEIPAPKSEWKSPNEGGYNGANAQLPAPVEIPVQNSEWKSPNDGGYNGVIIEIPAPVETPVQNSEWKSPDEGGYSGVNVSLITAPKVNFFGQGGPLPDLAIRDVSEALAMIQERVSIRLESLEDFQAELKTRRERMANVLPVQSSSVGTYGSIVIDNGFANDLNLDLGQFGGSPTANPNVPAIWPTTGVVTSPYGLRWGGTDFHPGIDIANDLGTPIVATADGIVEYAGWNAGGYGNMVDINHGNGLMTRYGHASQVVVTVGQNVKRGQLIAYMGSTGFSTGPHCHYEVHVSGQRVNPISYL